MKHTIIIMLLFSFYSLIALAQHNNAATPIHQLRIYEVPKQNQLHFNERFRDHAIRIMKKHGFKIVAIWQSEAEGKLQFVYLLEWKDHDTMNMAWSSFMADQEWKDIKAATAKQYGTFVNNIEEKTLILTNYSPQTRLLKTDNNCKAKDNSPVVN